MKRLLIIDDSEADQYIAKHLFEKQSSEIQVMTALNGKTGLEIYEQNKNHIGAILLDLNMPVLDGFEFLQLLQSRGYHDIDIYVLTSSLLDKDFKKCRSIYPVVDCIAKPLKNQNVWELIERLK